MKILSGRLRGRGIAFKANPHLRPTSDKVRKAIADILRPSIEGAHVLDLFSGTGALGFEALSMGALWVTFVESNKNQCRNIRENLDALGLTGEGDVIQDDAINAIEQMAVGEPFDLVFVDPPYQKGLGSAAMKALAASGICRQDALVVLESERREVFPETIGNFKTLKTKVYGDTKLMLYQKVQRVAQAR